MPVERRIPWGRPKHEILLLGLIALVALSPVDPVNPQDVSRVCLAHALVHGRVSADACLSDALDRSSYHGHLYSDKAPGLAVVEIPAVEAVSLGAKPTVWGSDDLRLWAVRVLSVGLCFLACAFLVGRVSEGLAPGYGAVALVAFALGTLVEPFAATGFAHDASAAFLFGAFLLAWRDRPLGAGLLAGGAVLVDYGVAPAVAIIGLYVLWRGWRRLARFVAGGLPALAALAAYDQAAFGAPWHLSYSYVDNLYAADQHAGLFGIGSPHLVSSFEVFAGPGGLLVASPVLVLAAVGLYLMARAHRAEAIVCTAVTAAFVLLDCSYFLPYGGISPGPRFLVPALPFLALGVAPALRRFPRTTIAATVVSVVSMTALTLVWPSNAVLRQTVWGEVARAPFQLGASRFMRSLSANALGSLGLGRDASAGLVALGAIAALVVSLQSLPWPEIRERRALPGRGRPLAVIAAAVGGVYLVGGADVLAVFAYPYGNRTAGAASEIADVVTSISASPTTSYLGGYVNFVVTVAYRGNTFANVLLTVRLSPGMRLAGPPHYLIGSGCSAGSTFVCDLGYLPAGHSTNVYFGAQMTDVSPQTVSAGTTSVGVAGYNHPQVTIPVGR